MAERLTIKESAKMTVKTIAAALLASLFLALAVASPALAKQQISSFTTTSSTTQAGGHPDLETTFSLEEPGVSESAKNVIFNAPAGVFGNINAVTNCQPAEFALYQCPPNSQVGLITVYANYEGNSNYLLGTAPLYDVSPQADQTALLQFITPILNIPISIPITVRTGSDYGLRFTVSDITQLTPLAGAHLIIWGLPASPLHTSARFPAGSPGSPSGCPERANASCNPSPTVASIPNEPFTDNPTTCSEQELVTELAVETYQDPGVFSSMKSGYPAITGCERETFKPLLQGQPTTGETDSASGLNLVLSAQQFEGFAASPSEIKSSTVTLPAGLTINPDAADGQSACRDVEANFGSEAPEECPDNAKIGTLSISSPTLDLPLHGSVYIGEPKPGEQYRLFLTASGFGMNIKLIGRVTPDPATGQLTVSFSDLPQLPFEEFEVHLFSGERGLMATPTGCTVYPISGQFFPWDEALPDQTSLQFFSLTSGPHGSQCPGQVRPFNPGLEAGTANPHAGTYSDFALKLNREDGDQDLAHLNFIMPPGLTADLQGVAYCPEAQILLAAKTPGRTEQAAPSCPAASQIGTSNVAAGPGSHPFHAVGRVYLAGPFQGAPLSLAVITPALAGPYDYGTVVVRVALNIDPHDAHVIADSEAIPEIIGGIPLRLREISVHINREHFMLNPTNCSEFQTVSEGVGDQGTGVAFSSPFTAVNCATLPFRPRMTITQLGKRKDTRRSADPRLRFALRARSGDANLKSVAVTLPTAWEVDQRHLANLCSKAQLESERCAGRQAIGTVEDRTPLLEAPLKGPAYAVSGYGRLPHLAFILAGQVTIVPEAISSSVKGGHLKTVVPVIPDAPVGRFALTLYGGKRGYLENTRSLCASAPVTAVTYTAQNGKRLTRRVKAKTACGATRRPKRRHRRR